MKVSQVEIIPIRPKEGLIGFATVEMDDQLLLHSIGIHRKKDGSGYRLTYPSRSGYSSELIKLSKKRVSEEAYQRQKQENDEFSYYLSVRNLGFQTDRRQNLKEQEVLNDKHKADRS